MPLDPEHLRLAMIAAVDGADALARLASRSTARLDAVRLVSHVRDTQRLAGKPGVSAATVATARARVVPMRKQAVMSAALAARSRIEPWEAGAEQAYLHGRIIAPNGAPQSDLRLTLMNVAGQQIADSPTDDRGYFRFTIPGPEADTALLVVAYRGAGPIYRDQQPFTLRVGACRYREIVVPASAAAHVVTETATHPTHTTDTTHE